MKQNVMKIGGKLRKAREAYDFLTEKQLRLCYVNSALLVMWHCALQFAMVNGFPLCGMETLSRHVSTVGLFIALQRS